MINLFPPKTSGMTPLLHVQDQKASSTYGGSSSRGDNKRDLNMVLTNEINGASLIDNDDEIRLPAGTYWIQASAPAFQSNQTRARLKNETDGVNIIYGTSEFLKESGDGYTTMRSFICGRFTLSAEKDVSIIHYFDTDNYDNGLGIDSDDGNVEVYTDVQIWKVG